jgi:hypothetical protein
MGERRESGISHADKLTPCLPDGMLPAMVISWWIWKRDGLLRQLPMQIRPLALALAVLLVGCTKAKNEPAKRDVPLRKDQPVKVDISLRNDSAVALDWVTLDWTGPDVPGGILSPGIWKMTVGADWQPTTNAVLTFVDDATRKPYRINLTLAAVDEQIRAGRCRNVVISIMSFEKAEARCE